MTLVTRQSSGQTAPTPTAAPYDHRWLLFLIPIFLLFIGLTFLVWYLLRRRKKQNQRKSVLRNRVLVVAEQEKQRDREEKRLSRGNSRSSMFSRKTSQRSAMTKTRSNRTTEATSLGTNREGYVQANSISTHGHIDNGEEEARDNRGKIEDKMVDSDVEYMAESAATLPVTLASPEASSSRVRIVEEAKPFRIKRKEVGKDEGPKGKSAVGSRNRGESSNTESVVLGLSQEELGNSGWTVDREDSQKNVVGVTSSLGHSSNPFATPSTSSAGHEKLLSPEAANVEINEREGLTRKVSGMARFRQPSPAASSRNIQRSDSRTSRKSSIRSINRADIQSPIPMASVSLAPSNWTYTSQAANWKSSSTDVSRSGLTLDDKRDGATSVNVVSPDGGEGTSKPSDGTSAASLLSPEVGQLTRKPSNGVAGSKFVESFDEE